ncbi:CAP domain-containing protein [Caldisalinibacter kiritimatiensis]|uniref:SH3b domain-containing protein n=1 Tax=Caldisalinibacter kiritimatiensis TaxID=1304284 RepID=R1CM14_9FIRM|nr:CAP domain-containing protein [Caldisalinibacter kiritimatiensis]EOC99750.1 hypothetical protein L21TH_2228 [Caldisalinibacter kiritimatiensis]
MSKKILIVILTLVMLAGCASPQEKPNEQPQDKNMKTMESSIYGTEEVKNIRVLVNNLNVRAGNGTQFPTIGKFNKNDEVKVLGKLPNWYIVQLPNNRVGCVADNYCKPIVKEGEVRQKQRQEGENQINQSAPNQAQNQQGNEGMNGETDRQQNMGMNRETDQQQNMGMNRETDQQRNEVTPARSLTQNEQNMVNLINEERRKRNLQPLKVDLELTKLARMKSQDMVDNNYFSHYSPTYGSPFDMMKTYGIDYLYAGENIAANSSVERAHTSLMNSQGHRENILKREFTHVGIGIVRSDKYGYMFTQMFISKPK